MENFGKFMTVLLALIISPIIKGYVFTKLWLWFIVPTMHMHPLRVIESIGIMFLIGFIRAKPDKEPDNDKFWENFGISMLFTIFISAFALLSGYIVKLFM